MQPLTDFFQQPFDPCKYHVLASYLASRAFFPYHYFYLLESSRRNKTSSSSSSSTITSNISLDRLTSWFSRCHIPFFSVHTSWSMNRVYLLETTSVVHLLLFHPSSNTWNSIQVHSHSPHHYHFHVQSFPNLQQVLDHFHFIPFFAGLVFHSNPLWNLIHSAIRAIPGGVDMERARDSFPYWIQQLQ